MVTSRLEPGQLVRRDDDVEVAAQMLRVIQALHEVRDLMGGTVYGRALKEVLWFRWEQPRLPRPLVNGKYPFAYPWSAQAREIWHRSPSRSGRPGQLVIEHIVPKRELLAKIVEETESLTVERLLDLLREAHSAVVISKEEDSLVTKAGWAHRSPDPTDVWARYRAAGLDIDGFAPLKTAV